MQPVLRAAGARLVPCAGGATSPQYRHSLHADPKRHVRGAAVKRCAADRLDLLALPVRSCSNSIGEQRSEYRRLLRRYQRLTWCTSAIEQRERVALQQPLMELYRLLCPETLPSHLDDDFDTLLRAQRRS
jgi:hypothetical protein